MFVGKLYFRLKLSSVTMVRSQLAQELQLALVIELMKELQLLSLQLLALHYNPTQLLPLHSLRK